MGGEGKGRRRAGKGRGGEVDSDAQLEQGRRLAKPALDFFLVLLFQTVLKSCSVSIMLISVCRYMLLTVLCIVNLLVSMACDIFFLAVCLCNYQFVHYSGFCRISPSILNRFTPNLKA